MGMTVLRAILILVTLAVMPVHAASAAAPGGVVAAMDHSAMPDCCQDGSHQTPACQMHSDFREQAIPVYRPRVLAWRVAFRADRLTGRMPEQALPPPRLI